MPTTYTYTVKITVPDGLNLHQELPLPFRPDNQCLADEIQSGLEWLGVEVEVEET